MGPQSEVVFLFDVDNTLLDNDRGEADLGERLETAFGVQGRSRYFQVYEELRDEVGYADFLGAFQRFWEDVSYDQRLLLITSWYLNYPFSDRLYAGALDVLAHVGQWGPVVVVTDGDVVFQPHKVRSAGLWDAVEGRVLIYLSKDERVSEIQTLYPARHYVAVDDKPALLAALKESWGERVTTVWPRQGHYAHELDESRGRALADITVEQIGALAEYELTQFLPPRD